MTELETIRAMLADADSDNDEIDVAIYEYVTGSLTGAIACPEYTTSLDAASSIGADELEGWTWVASTNDSGCHFNFYSPNPDHMRNLSRVIQSDFLPTAPRAICDARLQALEHVRKEKP